MYALMLFGVSVLSYLAFRCVGSKQKLVLSHLTHGASATNRGGWNMGSQ